MNICLLLIEHIIVIIFRNVYFRKLAAGRKSTFIDRCHTVRNRDAVEVAFTERPFADEGDTLAEGDAAQVFTVHECPVVDGGDTVGEGDAGQACAESERFIADGGDTVAKGDAAQV